MSLQLKMAGKRRVKLKIVSISLYLRNIFPVCPPFNFFPVTSNNITSVGENKKKNQTGFQ